QTGRDVRKGGFMPDVRCTQLRYFCVKAAESDSFDFQIILANSPPVEVAVARVGALVGDDDAIATWFDERAKPEQIEALHESVSFVPQPNADIIDQRQVGPSGQPYTIRIQGSHSDNYCYEVKIPPTVHVEFAV